MLPGLGLSLKDSRERLTRGGDSPGVSDGAVLASGQIRSRNNGEVHSLIID
jgi:hypothetical protein